MRGWAGVLGGFCEAGGDECEEKQRGSGDAEGGGDPERAVERVPEGGDPAGEGSGLRPVVGVEEVLVIDAVMRADEEKIPGTPGQGGRGDGCGESAEQGPAEAVCAGDEEERGRKNEDGGGFGEDHEAEQEPDDGEQEGLRARGSAGQPQREEPGEQEKTDQGWLENGEAAEGVEERAGDEDGDSQESDPVRGPECGRHR